MVPPDLDGAIVSSHYFLFELDSSRLDRRYLEFFLRTRAFMEEITAQGSTNYAAMRPADVHSYTIPLPPLRVQRRIVASIEAWNEHIRPEGLMPTAGHDRANHGE